MHSRILVCTRIFSANPVAMLNAGADLLSHLGLARHSDLVRTAVFNAVNTDRVHTKDLGGTASTTDVIHSVISNIKNSPLKYENY